MRGLVCVRIGILLALSAVVAGAAAADTNKIYWSGRDEPPVLQRANTDGTELEDVIQAETYLVDLDPVARKLYWLQGSAPGVTLRRSNLDGTGLEVLDEYGGLSAGPLTVGGGWIYVAKHFFEGCIGVVRYDLNGVPLGLILPGECPWGLEVDPVARKLYWSTPSDNTIRRSELDGTGTETLVAANDTPVCIELDLGAGKVYWNNRFDSIQRANLDGSGAETLVDGVGYVRCIALDLTHGKLYWAGEFVDEIRRADLDGSNQELFLAIGADGLAIDPVAGGADVPAASPWMLVVLLLVLTALSTLLVRRRSPPPKPPAC